MLPPAEQRAEKEAGKQGLPAPARAARERSMASAARTTGEPTSPDSSGMPRERIPKKTAHTMQKKKMRHEGPKRGPSFWKDPPHGGGSPHSRRPNPNSNGRLTSIHPFNPLKNSRCGRSVGHWELRTISGRNACGTVTLLQLIVNGEPGDAPPIPLVHPP